MIRRAGFVFASAVLALFVSCASPEPGKPEPRPPLPDPTGSAPAGMVLVKGGTYVVGTDSGDRDEAPSHSVVLDPFYIDVFEVTNAEFARFVTETSYVSEGQWKTYASAGRERHPVASVTWNDASAYAAWAGKRLPTEHEWETAARGGLVGSLFPTGDALTAADATYNFVVDETIRTTPVGEKPANGYGIHDTAGNVWEWCSDWYASDAYRRATPNNPPGPERGAARVMRGGSWNERSVACRVSNRLEMTPTMIGFVFGFRCAKTP